jgi:thioredoxin reductase
VLRFNDGPAVTAQTMILATGVSYRRLAAPDLEALTGCGVFYAPARDRRSMDKPSSPAPARARLRSRLRALTGPP